MDLLDPADSVVGLQYAVCGRKELSCLLCRQPEQVSYGVDQHRYPRESIVQARHVPANFDAHLTDTQSIDANASTVRDSQSRIEQTTVL